jgi:Ca-activated chloride channel family protein
MQTRVRVDYITTFAPANKQLSLLSKRPRFDHFPAGGHTRRTIFRMYFATFFRRPITWIFLCLLVLSTQSVSRAQDPDDEVIRTETSLVQLNIGVVDKQGHPITSLTRNDFTVYEDGIKQTIQRFEPVEAPFSLVLLLDMSGSTINFRQQLKLASQRFLDALAPDDRVSVVQFDTKVKTLIGFNTDRRKTAYAIDIANGKGETRFYEALRYALRELDKEGKRRKAIVVLTDGLDTEMRGVDRRNLVNVQTDEQAIATVKEKGTPELNQILAFADRLGVSIFPLALPSGDPKRLPIQDPNITGIYTAARLRLQALSDRTGGRLNEINKLEQMALLYREVAASIRTLYTLSYQANNDRTRGKWHEIRIEVPNQDLTARTKPGYFGR